MFICEELKPLASQEGVVVVAAADGLGLLRVGGAGSVEVFGVPVVLPARAGPEEGLVSDLVAH